MEQRVRDLIESLQKFDLDTRVSEKTTLSFKYDGKATRLVAECNNVDTVVEIQKLHEANAKLEGVNEDLSEEIKELEVEVGDLEDEILILKRDLKLAGELAEKISSML